MKLLVRQVGGGGAVAAAGTSGKELLVTIRNPAATIANVRAAIAILFKLEPHGFRLRFEGTHLDDDKMALSATGLKDGDLVILTAKRSREGGEINEDEGSEGRSPLAANRGPAAENSGSDVVTPVAGVAPPPIPSSAAVSEDESQAQRSASATVDAEVQQIRMSNGGSTANLVAAAAERPTVAAASSSERTAASTTSGATRGTRAKVQRARHGTVNSGHSSRSGTVVHGVGAVGTGGGGDDDAFLQQRIQADEQEQLNQLSGDDDEENDDGDEGMDDDDDEGSEDDEVNEMVSLLLSVPNLLDMREQFLLNPQAVLASIQQSNPRLFHLIATHNEAFLNLVQSQTLLQTLQEEQEAQRDEHFIGEEDEELDEEDEALIHDMILQALGRDAAEHNEDDDGNGSEVDGTNQAVEEQEGQRTAGSSAATSVTLGRNATQILDSLRSTATMDAAFRSARSTANRSTTGAASARGTGDGSGAGAGEAASSSSSMPPSVQRLSSRGPPVIPAEIPPADVVKIEELMQLGFTRDQCVQAFYTCARSIERAANLLFESPPQL